MPVVQETGSEVKGDSKFTMTGTVRYQDIEGGFWGIIGDDGKSYDPTNLSKDFAIEGTRIEFTAQSSESSFSTHMWGAPIDLIEVKRLGFANTPDDLAKIDDLIKTLTGAATPTATAAELDAKIAAARARITAANAKVKAENKKFSDSLTEIRATYNLALTNETKAKFNAAKVNANNALVAKHAGVLELVKADHDLADAKLLKDQLVATTQFDKRQANAKTRYENLLTKSGMTTQQKAAAMANFAAKQAAQKQIFTKHNTSAVTRLNANQDRQLQRLQKDQATASAKVSKAFETATTAFNAPHDAKGRRKFDAALGKIVNGFHGYENRTGSIAGMQKLTSRLEKLGLGSLSGLSSLKFSDSLGLNKGIGNLGSGLAALEKQLKQLATKK